MLVPSGSYEDVENTSTPESGILAYLVGWPLALAAASWCLIVFMLWAPAYLAWPLFTDHDHFDMVARRWASGSLPYRDTFTMQFPGEIYVFYLLGMFVGWGNSAVFYALDALSVLGFGGMLLSWSKAKTGRWLPGWIGFLQFLNYYTAQGFAVTGQREWHGMFFASTSLLVPGLISGRAGRILSGLAFGTALAFRPQFVLLAPAILLALFQARDVESWCVKRTSFAWIEWGFVVVLSFGLAFFPLIRSGLFDDFLRCLGTIKYGSGYNARTFGSRALAVVHLVLKNPTFLVTPLAVGILSATAGRRANRDGWTVVLATIGMIAYSPISPQPHVYQDIPCYAALSMATTLLVGLLANARVLLPAPAFVAILLVACLGWNPPKMAMKSLVGFFQDLKNSNTANNSLDSPGPIVSLEYVFKRELPTRPPSGWSEWNSSYRWAKYRELILYLRERTEPDTPVASLLFEMLTAINGAVPRRSPLPCDAPGLLAFQQFLEIDQAALATEGPCVVVLDPAVVSNADGGGLKGLTPKLKPLVDLIHRDFKLETIIGPFEVWRRDGPKSSGSLNP